LFQLGQLRCFVLLGISPSFGVLLAGFVFMVGYGLVAQTLLFTKTFLWRGVGSFEEFSPGDLAPTV
jgi:hypothetical protein